MNQYCLKLFVLLCVGTVFQIGCANYPNNDSNLRRETPQCSTISEQTATLIAQGALQISHGESKFKISVHGKGDRWEVRFATKCVGCEDGNPLVIVSKGTGDVLQVLPFGEPEKLESGR